MSDLACCLESEDGGGTADIVTEMRGRNEDEKLRSHFNRIMDAGTGIIEAARFKARIVGYKPRPKSDNVNVLQVVDLCAYPLARHFIRPNEPYQPYDVIADKLYRRSGVECHECGFKILS
jgi:hypothetical protein